MNGTLCISLLDLTENKSVEVMDGISNSVVSLGLSVSSSCQYLSRINTSAHIMLYMCCESGPKCVERIIIPRRRNCKET